VEIHRSTSEVHRKYAELKKPDPVIYDRFMLIVPSSVPRLSPEVSPKTELKPIPSSVIKKQVSSKRPAKVIRGLASWYCKAGVSICHYAYPPGSMVAAACVGLRAAMGSWRGKTVTVTAGSKQVSVKLVDWCGSKSKILDLYWEPMRRLGGTGVLPVVVRWH
jgi:hypothetical protein